jgi:hypothetical protein
MLQLHYAHQDRGEQAQLPARLLSEMHQSKVWGARLAPLAHASPRLGLRPFNRPSVLKQGRAAGGLPGR